MEGKPEVFVGRNVEQELIESEQPTPLEAIEAISRRYETEQVRTLRGEVVETLRNMSPDDRADVRKIGQITNRYSELLEIEIPSSVDKMTEEEAKNLENVSRTYSMLSRALLFRESGMPIHYRTELVNSLLDVHGLASSYALFQQLEDNIQRQLVRELQELARELNLDSGDDFTSLSYVDANYRLADLLANSDPEVNPGQYLDEKGFILPDEDTIYLDNKPQ